MPVDPLDARSDLREIIVAGGWTATRNEAPDDHARAESPSPVERIGRFEIKRLLGEGGMGRVLVGYDEQLGRDVAIKLLRWAGERGKARTRLLREAQALARLSHPNVVQVYEAGTHDDDVYVVMELVAGHTLAKWLQDEPHGWTHALDLLLQAGRGLEAAHAAGIIHRDFKPDNVLVGDDGRVRVLDFGLARGRQLPGRSEHEPDEAEAASTMREAAAESSSGASRSGSDLDAELTAHGTIMGTPVYMAPEQHDGRPCDAAADQFAFCVTLFEALFGELPYARQSMHGLAMAKHAGRVVAIPRDKKVPRSVRDAILRGLAPSPEDRWPDLRALLDVLQRARAGPRRWWVPASTAALAAAVVAIGLNPFASAEDPCLDAGRAIEPVWSEVERQSARERLPEELAPSALESLDAWSTRWSRAAEQSCQDVHVRRVLSADSLDRRGACLARRLATFDAIVDAVVDGRVTTGPRLAESLGQLDEPGTCLDRAVLLETVDPLPAEHAEAIAEARRALADVELHARGQSLAERIAAVEQLLTRSRELGWRPLVGEAALVLGRLHVAANQGTAARARLGEAIDVGDRARDVELSAHAWSALNQAERLVEFDAERARWAWERESALFSEVEPSPRQRARLLEDLGQTEALAGESERAEALLREALTVLEGIEPAAAWQQARLLRDLGNLVGATRRAEAKELFARARQLELGPVTGRAGELATITAGVQLDEAIALIQDGDVEAAMPLLRRGLDAAVTEQGPRGELVARFHIILALAHDLRDELDELRRHAELADRISLEAVGARHPMRVDVLSAVGVSALRHGRNEDALHAFEASLRLVRLLRPSDSIEVAEAESNVATALRELGQTERADELAAHFQPILDAP